MSEPDLQNHDVKICRENHTVYPDTKCARDAKLNKNHQNFAYVTTTACRNLKNHRHCECGNDNNDKGQLCLPSSSIYECPLCDTWTPYPPDQDDWKKRREQWLENPATCRYVFRKYEMILEPKLENYTLMRQLKKAMAGGEMIHESLFNFGTKKEGNHYRISCYINGEWPIQTHVRQEESDGEREFELPDLTDEENSEDTSTFPEIVIIWKHILLLCKCSTHRDTNEFCNNAEERYALEIIDIADCNNQSAEESCEKKMRAAFEKRKSIEDWTKRRKERELLMRPQRRVRREYMRGVPRGNKFPPSRSPDGPPMGSRSPSPNERPPHKYRAVAVEETKESYSKGKGTRK